jgi:hypothetical protein
VERRRSLSTNLFITVKKGKKKPLLQPYPISPVVLARRPRGGQASERAAVRRASGRRFRASGRAAAEEAGRRATREAAAAGHGGVRASIRAAATREAAAAGKLSDGGPRRRKRAGDGGGSWQAMATKTTGLRRLGIGQRWTGMDRRRHELVCGNGNWTTARGIERQRMGKHGVNCSEEENTCIERKKIGKN